jgi:hypothetical protein
MFIDVHVLATLDLQLGLKIPIEIEMVSTHISASSQLIQLICYHRPTLKHNVLLQMHLLPMPAMLP